MDPTISVGGILKAIGGNIRVGNSEIFVTEACEYTNSFLSFFPKISVILNIDEDHLTSSRIWRISATLSTDLQSCFQKTEHLLSMVTLIVWMRLQEILTAKS